MDYKKRKYGIGTERVNFQKTTKDLEIPDLLKLQVESFQQFLDEGIGEVFQEIYPVESKKLLVEYLSHEIKMPKDLIEAVEEARTKGSNYAANVYAKIRITNKETGAKRSEDKAFIASIPLMTDGGSFIINGSERVIISQIVRAPGVYFENMKASRTQSASDAAVFKLATVIPSRGS